mmetsp:Transcript_52402/g.162021  ORF Transcript_52402/g.162021 Transcript_52402/m.162021 type:complete len:362 (-) Transcript_52402:63-1148(-)
MHDLQEKLLAQSLDVDLPALKLEVRGIEGNANRLVLRAVKLREVRMLQGLRHSATLVRVKLKRLVEEVDRRGRCLPENLLERLAHGRGQRLDELSALVVGYLAELLTSWCAQEGDDELQLMLRVVAREKRLPPQHLRKDAADGPDVDGSGVVDPGAEDLRCPVPARADVLRHGARLELLVRKAHARKPKVTDFEVAICVNKQVPGLEVAVDHLRRVHVLHAAEDLVEEELAVVIRKGLRALQDGSEVRLHELGDHVDVLKVLLDTGQKDAPHINQILVPQVPQDPELPQRPLGESDVLKGILDLFDRDVLIGHLILCSADDAIRTLTDRLEHSVPLGHLKLGAMDHVTARIELEAVDGHCR